MIPIGQEQRLGHKVFFLLALRRISLGIIFIILALALAIFSNYILGASLKFAIAAGISKANTASMLSMVLMYMNIIIFFLGVFICFLGILVAYFEYRNHTFRFDEFDFIMKEGILNKKENSIPYRQIQDVDIERPFNYLVLGLSRLVLKTGGTEEKGKNEMTEINIEPVDKGMAEEIQEMLERKIGVQVVETDTKADKEESSETTAPEK